MRRDVSDKQDLTMMDGWKSKLRIRMILSHVSVFIAAVLLLEILCAFVVFFGEVYVQRLPEASTSAFSTNFVIGFLPIALIILLIAIPLGAAFSLITSHGIIRRMQRLVDATAQIASGHYDQRVTIRNGNGEGMLELFERQFNLIADQLMQSIEQRRVLTEQNARLAERTSIIRDLHDSVKQQAFALTMQISTALASIDTKPEVARTHLQNSEVLAYQVQQELSALISSSRPSMLSEKGLASALQEYVTMWSQQQQISVQQHIDACTLSPLLEEALLRITQEAFSNIARHSHTTTVTLDLFCKQDLVTLVVKDNGCGFDLHDPTLTMRNGVGLQSMRERMKAFHGTLLIESKNGEGTRIVASCPYPNDKDSYRATQFPIPLLFNKKEIE